MIVEHEKYNIMEPISWPTEIAHAQVACLYWKLNKSIDEITEITIYAKSTVKGYVDKYHHLVDRYDDYFNPQYPKFKTYERTPLPVFHDNYHHVRPDEDCGLYLVGSTHFDPHTMMQYYWIKVGMSTNLKKRIKSYHTENPMVFVADTMICDISDVGAMENDCHIALSDVAYGIAEDTIEWFIVSRETYLEICREGFRYFFS